jgi:hypothetical protein
MTVKGILDDKIVSGLIAYARMVILRHILPKTLGLEINQYVSIPRIRQFDEKQRFIGK